MTNNHYPFEICSDYRKMSPMKCKAKALPEVIKSRSPLGFWGFEITAGVTSTSLPDNTQHQPVGNPVTQRRTVQVSPLKSC